MARWGKKEKLDLIGSVRLTTGSATVLGATGPNMVAGSTGPTQFLTQVKAGNTITVPLAAATGVFVVASVESNTSLTLTENVTGATGVYVTGAFATQVPNYLSDAEKKESVFGVDITEAGVTPVAHAGWVKVTHGTGNRTGRVKRETLVAMGVPAAEMGDAEDTEFPNS
jgi:hypothetical protein